MTDTATTSWLLMLVQVPSEPSRHRVAVWREMRCFGAVPVGHGAWTAPDVPSWREGAGAARDRSNRSKDVFVTESAERADQELSACAAVLEDFAGYVYRELHS
ncbi:Chromate resistance protein ChrB [Pseudarthrobacter sp. N5]|uniref:Chromate resistance protein ChrB n=1 Tax=Pseudarthrobacter sp. N5 TaxID=3418416 RepID=UPI003CE9E581